MLLEQQKTMSTSRSDWIGKFVIEVAYDLYKFGVKIHGPEKFSSEVVSKILSLAHFVDCLAEEDKQEEKSTNDDDEEHKYYSRLFLTSKVFLRHLACLAFVTCFLSAPISNNEEEEDDEENKIISQLFEAILSGGE